MDKQNSFKYLWPTLFGSFHNPDHSNIKNQLIKYFEEYKKKILLEEEVEKIINCMKAITTYTYKKAKLLTIYLKILLPEVSLQQLKRLIKNTCT